MSARAHGVAVALLLGGCLALTSATAWAGTVRSISVQHRKSSYSVDLKMTIDAPRQAVYRVLTDYSRLPRINPAIRYARVLPTPPGQPTQVKSRVHLCVAFFCRNMDEVQKMYTSPPDRLRAVMIPAESDFKSGTAAWSLSPEGRHTLLHFHADVTPAFWVPPLIGPWMIRRVLRSQAIRTARGVEKAARAGS